MTITNYRIDGAPFVPTPKNTEHFVSGNLDTIIIHYTAGGTADSAIRTLTDPNVRASAHVVVDREGSITQLVPFNTIAWHAGASQYGNRVGFNKYSIGIEIDNAGVLEKRGDKYYSWFGRAYEEKDVIQGVHRNESVPKYWHAYTEKQIEAVKNLCILLIKEYNLKFMLGHEEISPGRKVDPGPAFPLDKLRTLLFEPRSAETAIISGVGKILAVTADSLNIRSEGNVQAEKIAKPLIKGQKVKILEAKEGWYKVSTEVTGWISAKYVK